MSPSIAQLLERSRRELLDLSTRNRLLSMPVGSKSARWVEIEDERADQVYRMLAVERRVFGFVPGVPVETGQAGLSVGPTAGSGAGSGDGAGRSVGTGIGKEPEGKEPEVEEGLADLPPPDESEDGSVSGAGAPGSKGVDGAGKPPARRHVDARLQTRLTPEALQRRLLDLYRDARTMIEEQGVNILYLALGQLRWTDPAEPTVVRHAPLVLVPVELARRTASDRFQLTRREEEIQDNLSLAAKLKADFGLTLPEIGDEEEFDPLAFCRGVGEAVREREGWEVLPHAMVLGFFSFAKFLMYRDLDPANWPEADRLLKHPLVAGLMQEGFPGGEAALPEDTHLDEWIPAGRLDHVVDADGSQTLAIEAVRRGRSVVIQGPPGTGKSQSITNVIATAVLDGKRVLFVAEKLAALEVVKRRLEKEGLGPLCLELHSNKASKRAVLEEIGNTWKLGKPRAVDGETTIARLEQSRRWLNEHARALHAEHRASGLSPYRILGELLALGDRGVLPDGEELAFEGLEGWASVEHADRRRLVGELVQRVMEIGVPRRHPWRGVGRGMVQRLDLGPLSARIRAVMERLAALQSAGRALAEAWGAPPPETLAGWERLHGEARHASAAPEGMDRSAATHDGWRAGQGGVTALVGHGARLGEVMAEVGGRVAEAAWAQDYSGARAHLAAHGRSLFRFLNGDYRRAVNEVRVGLKGELPDGHEARLALVDRVIQGQAAQREVVAGDTLGRGALGAVWAGPRTAWLLAVAIVDWMARGREMGFDDGFRQRFATVRDPGRLGDLAGALRSALDAARPEMEALGRELELDWSAAFDERVPGIEEVRWSGFPERARTWLERMEDLGTWCGYQARAREGRAAGLGPLVDRLETGTVPAEAASEVFERACWVQLWRDVNRERPELAGFDGLIHEGRVTEFRQWDVERLKLARHRTLAAHYDRLPPENAAVGAAGIVRAELERKRGHRAVRRLLRDAGTVVQAIKPVFMMSPLSVAQYLEPGAVEFDLLVIDEASQVQPVDALGAVARCRQMVVVGDSRQLPPTRFFARLTGGDGGEGDGDWGEGAGMAAEARDIESILGLCCARGLPQRMLRWHYRSRHHSLIAVSNREFYDGRLFIVPSPHATGGGMGLRFHHVADGVFDSGGTGSNRVEAKVVCRAILRHARRTPGSSLGVAGFSVRQQQAILDELELLRRENPDTEAFFTAHPTEPFFVKNLENVQGDERDVIFISVGYGRDVNGVLAMRFGPLAVEGGERRLNVLISRAKRRCEVFSSITADEIDLNRSGGRGVAALKTFLAFAQSGALDAGPGSDAAGAAAGPDGARDAVRRAIEALGYEVRPRVGIAGFFIDLAVLDPERASEGRYLLGVELDGPEYAAARSARDRDRLRPAVLSDHGWRLHRIWTPDWFQRPSEQVRRLQAALERARAEASESAVDAEVVESGTPGDGEGSDGAETELPDGVDVAEKGGGVEREEAGIDGEDALAEPYCEARLDVPAGSEPHLLPTRELADVLRRVVEIEGPVHEDELVTRVRTLWGLGRAGARVQDAVARAVRALVAGRECLREDGFLTMPGAPVPVRNRAGVGAANLRKAEFLPPAEIREAVVRLVSVHHGAKPAEIPAAVARLLGFRSTGPALRDRVREQVARLVSEGRLEEVGGMLRRREETVGGNGLT